VGDYLGYLRKVPSYCGLSLEEIIMKKDEGPSGGGHEEISALPRGADGPSYSEPGGERKAVDYYYRLDLRSSRIPSKIKNMIHRAGRELRVEKSREFDAEHQKLIDDFLGSREVEEGTRVIFQRLPITFLPSQPPWSLTPGIPRAVWRDLTWPTSGLKNMLFTFQLSLTKISGSGTSDLLLQALIKKPGTSGSSM